MKKHASVVLLGTLASSQTFAMDSATKLAEMLDSMPTIYGNIQLVHVQDTTKMSGNESKDNELGDNLSTLGFKHSHEISEGLTGFFKAEFEYNGDNNKEGSGLDKLDEAYLGLKGDFGSIQVGSDDTVYEWTDMVDIDETYGLIDSEIAADQEGDNIQYVSPEIAEGLTIGVTVPLDSDTTFAGALAGTYETENFSIAAAYSMGRKEGAAEDGDTFALAGTFALDDLSIIGQYETKSEGASGSKDGKDFTALMGVYAMGANQFVLGYGLTSYDASGAEDTSTIYVQALHNLSDHMYTFIEYTDSSDVGGVKGDERDILAIGAAYSF